MVTFNKILGRLNEMEVVNRSIDVLFLEWFEAGKRIFRKKTVGNVEVIFKSMEGPVFLNEGDVIYIDEHKIIVIEIVPCEVISILPQSAYEIASLSYEIGNKHAPLFIENDSLLIPFELPLFRSLEKQGYVVSKENKKLLYPLKTSVSAHLHSEGQSLFSKIMRVKKNES